MREPFDDCGCGRRHEGDLDGMDACYMGAALGLARKLENRTWPNPPVGAVVVRDGQVVGRGFHAGAGQAHAEPVALAEAGAAARGATLYVTLEPCNHTGRTPPCTTAILESGVSRVVIGMRDPNPTVAGGGARFLRERGLEVDVGVLGHSCLALVWPFVASDNFRRVYVELKTATSLDGLVAPAPELRTPAAPFYLTGEASRNDVHRRRRWMDLILVGEGTVAADRPRLDCRLAAEDRDLPQAEPLAGYVDTDLSYQEGLDRDSYLVFAGESARGGVGRAAVERDGGQIIFCREKDGRVDPRAIVEACAARDIYTVMLESGPRLAGAFLAEGLVDRWVRYQAPVVLGRGCGWSDVVGFQPDRGFSLTAAEPMAGDLMTIHDRRDFEATLERVTM